MSIDRNVCETERHFRDEQRESDKLVAQPTPGPWEVDPDSRAEIRSATDECFGVVCGDPMETADATDEANAAFIVRACNSHDDLLAALRGLIDATEDTLRTHPETACCAVTRERCKAARAALTEATE